MQDQTYLILPLLWLTAREEQLPLLFFFFFFLFSAGSSNRGNKMHNLCIFWASSNSKTAFLLSFLLCFLFSFSVLVGSRFGQGQQHFRAVLPHSRGLAVQGINGGSSNALLEQPAFPPCCFSMCCPLLGSSNPTPNSHFGQQQHTNSSPKIHTNNTTKQPQKMQPKCSKNRAPTAHTFLIFLFFFLCISSASNGKEGRSISSASNGRKKNRMALPLGRKEKKTAGGKMKWLLLLVA